MKIRFGNDLYFEKSLLTSVPRSEAWELTGPHGWCPSFSHPAWISYSEASVSIWDSSCDGYLLAVWSIILGKATLSLLSQLLLQSSLKKPCWRLPGRGRGELQAFQVRTQKALSQRSRINNGWWEWRGQGHAASTLQLRQASVQHHLCNIVPVGKCLLNPNGWFGNKLWEQRRISAGDAPYLDRWLR